MGNEQTWDPARALLELKQEQDALGADFNEAALTERRLRTHAPIAADTLVHLMQYSSSERIRLDAAKTIMDRVLGKVSDAGLMSNGGELDPFQQLLNQCIVDTKLTDAKMANTGLTVTSSDPTPTHGFDGEYTSEGEGE